jgi:hypothetical protein
MRRPALLEELPITQRLKPALGEHFEDLVEAGDIQSHDLEQWLVCRVARVLHTVAPITRTNVGC